VIVLHITLEKEHALLHSVDDPNDCIDAVSMAKVTDSGSLGEDIPEDLKELPRLYGWLEDVGRRLAIMSENLRRVHAAGIPVATATDSGHPMTFHGSAIHAEIEAMAQAGLDPAEVLVMSTRNGAGLMGRLEDMGTLEPGKIAKQGSVGAIKGLESLDLCIAGASAPAPVERWHPGRWESGRLPRRGHRLVGPGRQDFRFPGSHRRGFQPLRVWGS
jgi:hypothetical protein